MSSGRWSVRVGLDVAEPQPAVFPTVVVVGVAPGTGPRLGDVYPTYKQRTLSSQELELDHVRLPAGAQVELLPGLDARYPSLVRDTVRTLLAAGAPTVDVMLVRGRGLAPWFVSTPDVVRVVMPVLELLTGVPVLFPDAGGPVRVGLTDSDPAARLAGLVVTARAWSGALRRGCQIGLIDLPATTLPGVDRAVHAMSRSDFVLCGFEGDGVSILSQGWRSPSSVVGAMLATLTTPAQSHVGRRIVLGQGHDVRSLQRARELGLPVHGHDTPPSVRDAVARVRLVEDGRVAELVSEPTLRGEPGSWPLPLLHAVKLVHDRLVFASNVFVFREATPAQAFLLQGALRMALKEFEDLGVITGMTVGEPPMVQTGHHGGPDSPSLVAQVTALVRPWVHKLVVNLAVRPGDVVRSEVAS